MFEARRVILSDKINFPLTLAPMVGLTHVALRLVIRDYMPAGAKTIWPTEMLNSRRIPGEDLSTTPEAMRSDLETELVPQILGNEKEYIQASVAKLVEWGAEAIDINMGCPVQKALRHNYGVALMGDAGYAAQVVRMTVEGATVPISVKLRAGTQSDFIYLQNFVQGLFDAGASWVTLHPRTAAQKRRGFADWEQIRKLRECVSAPIIGNGDIQTAEDVDNMLLQTKCDMVMAGRALAARPWLMWQCGERWDFAAPELADEKGLGVVGEDGKRRAPLSREEEGAEYGRCLLRLLRLSRHYFGENLALRKIRFYVRTTSVWLLFGQSLISVVNKGKNLQEVEEGIENFFSIPVEMLAKTDLRE